MEKVFVALLSIMSVVFSFTSGELLRIIITVPLNHTYLLTVNLVSAEMRNDDDARRKPCNFAKINPKKKSE
jgi:hypothetical protein